MKKYSVEVTDRDPRLEGCRILHTTYDLIWDSALIESQRRAKSGDWVSIYSQTTGECMEEIAPRDEVCG